MAEHRYARLTETINISEDYADLANEDPLAALDACCAETYTIGNSRQERTPV